MRDKVALILACAALACPAGFAAAKAPQAYIVDGVQQVGELPPYLQCVPYARQVSGIEIYGDAWTWWDKAAGRYARGHTPRPGAVMAFQAYGNMTLGHVAAVSRVIDARTVLLRHANWSPIGGRRGQIENDVEAVDVSPGNDWSQVRVWYAPIQNLGTTAWPVSGFIYPSRDVRPTFQLVRADAANHPGPSRAFLQAFEAFDAHEPARQSLVARDKRKKGRAPVDLIAQIARN